MGERRQARILALQALYYADVDKGDPKEILELFCEHLAGSITETVNPLFFQLVTGVSESLEQLDTLLNKYATNWRVSRMSVVDRNVLRMAIYEFLNCQDIPATVSINEAVDIGKRFGTRTTGPFVNGILDRIRLSEQIVSTTPPE
jgi:N utilization substance protein B